MGADGVDLEFGVTTTNMMEANLNRMMMNTSQQTVLLVDSSKFGKNHRREYPADVSGKPSGFGNRGDCGSYSHFIGNTKNILV